MKKIFAGTFFLFIMLNGFAGNNANLNSNNNLLLVLAATVTQSNVTCNGQCNGSATVIASGGAAPYSYQWVPVAPNTPTVNGLCAGSYTVIVTDASSATVAVVFTITQPPPLNLASSANSSICPGSCKTLTASAFGGIPPYTYNWQPGNIGGGTITVCPSFATTYTVMASDSYSCITANIVSISITNTVANAGPTKSITCVNSTPVLNGSGLTTYSWTGPGIVSGAFTASPTVSSPGIYSLTGTNGGCASNTATVMVVMNTGAPSVMIASSTNTLCAGNSATLVVNIVAGCTYSWSNGSTGQTAVVSPTSSTTYTVWATNISNGCTGSATQGIGVTQLNVTASSPSNVCDGTMACLTASGASTYTWTGPCGFYVTQASPCFPFYIACGCTFSVTGAIANGCSKTATVCLNVITPPAVSLMTTDSIICIGQTATLTISGASSYTWNTGSTATVIAVSPTVNTSYSVTASNGTGCDASAFYTQSVTACTGIKNVSMNEDDFFVYPNPSAGVFIIKTNADSDIVIYNATGKEVLFDKLKTGTNNIDLSKQPGGIYFVKCGGVIKRVIKE